MKKMILPKTTNTGFEPPTYQQWECYRDDLDTLHNPHAGHGNELDDCEDVDAVSLHMTEIHKVRLVLDWFKQQQNPLYKLEQ